MARRIVVIGAGGFGREIVELIEAINESSTAPEWEVLGFLDDGHPDRRVLEAYGMDHLGPVEGLDDLDTDVEYVIGVGAPRVRRAIDERARASGRPSPVLVHPNAWIGRRAVSLGPGTIVCSHVSITNHVTLGRHVHVNLSCTIGHDAVLEDYVTLSPLVAVSGNVHAEPQVLVGTGASLNPGVRLGRESTVGAGAAVVTDVPEATTVVGIPARPIGG